MKKCSLCAKTKPIYKKHSTVCTGKRKYAGGYIWRYSDGS